MNNVAVYVVSLIAVMLLSGCGIQIPGMQQDDAPPRITAEPAAVREYREQVQPILDDTVRDVARVANVDVQVKDGQVSVGVDPNAVQQAEKEAKQGLEELKKIDPPQGLEDTHQRLIRSYEEGIPALNNFIAAVQSGDAGQISRSVREDLPKIQRFLSDIQTIQQQLQQAGGQ